MRTDDDLMVTDAEFDQILLRECHTLSGEQLVKTEGTVRKVKPTDNVADTTLETMLADAEAAVAHLVRLELGSPFDTPATKARQALEAVQAAATQQLFPDTLEPVADGVLRDLDMLRASCPAPLFGDATAYWIGAHAEALNYPALRDCIRTRRVLRAIIDRSKAEGNYEPEGMRQAETRHLGRFTLAIAKQLHERHLEEPAAGILVEQLPTLHAEFVAAVRQHVEHAAAEAERRRLEVEAAATRQRDAETAAERAIWAKVLREEKLADDPAQLERRQSLTAWYRRGDNSRALFPVLDRRLSGEQCAEALECGAPYLAFYRAQNLGVKPSRRP